MKTLSQQMTVFGDYYYNSSREEIGELAKSLKKYPLSDIADYLKKVMQDILAHLAGSTSFQDACMVKGKLHFEAMINNRIGKKKLVELLSLIEELDILEIYLDEVTFLSNENDAFLDKAVNNEVTRKNILLPYLKFNNLSEFFEMVIMIMTMMPMARRTEDFNIFMPDPIDFDFKKKYYETIDYLMYYRDEKRHDDLVDKHRKNGREISIVDWIKNYKERYDLKELLQEKMNVVPKTDNATDNNWNGNLEDIINVFMDFASSDEYNFSDDELDRLRVILFNKSKEILMLGNQIVKLRGSVLMIMSSQGIDLSEEEIENIEKEYVMETVISSITKAKRKKKAINFLLYSAIIATLVLLPNNSKENKLESSNNNYIAVEESKETDKEEKDDKEESTPLVDDVSGNDIKTDESVKEDEEVKQEEHSEDDDSVFKTDFVIGETCEENVPYYISSTSDEILGFLDEDVVTIAYFATIDGKDGVKVLCSCRTQEEMDKFLRLYHGDGKEIQWRAAVARANNPKVKEFLESGQEIPYDQTICYIDCDPVKKMELIRGDK